MLNDGRNKKRKREETSPRYVCFFCFIMSTNVICTDKCYHNVLELHQANAGTPTQHTPTTVNAAPWVNVGLRQPAHGSWVDRVGLETRHTCLEPRYVFFSLSFCLLKFI